MFDRHRWQVMLDRWEQLLEELGLPPCEDRPDLSNPIYSASPRGRGSGTLSDLCPIGESNQPS